MKEETHTFDFCVVGGGMAGLIAALAAARRGARVALVHDRPVLGGNASSEIRMHICGAHGPDNRETGILEELLLENQYRNPQPNYSIWDSVLYGKVQYQTGIELFLNCSVYRCDRDGPRIRSVTGWQMTTETRHTIRAGLFADCSGDGILAPLSGAGFRIGREGRGEYGESIAPPEADRRTMGMSCLLQAREYAGPQPFIPPAWASRFTRPEDLNGRDCDIRRTNFWWIEIGGDRDSIHDAERLREELLRLAFGVWDYIKNHAPDRERAENWALDWVGFLPGKRESRRYVGDHVLTQPDIEAGGRFDDVIAYGGWTMDDHFPEGFHHPMRGNVFHPTPSPFGIPYRSLYSRDIENLFCAGRCHSASHAALSATRVMGTTSVMGQAVGTAAALAAREGLSPRTLLQRDRIGDVQQMLMEDDAFLPGRTRAVPTVAREAKLQADAGSPEALRNGVDRPVAGTGNDWTAPPGAAVSYLFAGPRPLREARIVFDSDLNRRHDGQSYSAKNMRCLYALDARPWSVPRALTRAFRVELLGDDGAWRTVHEEGNNYQRLVRVPLPSQARGVRLVPLQTWGADICRLFAFDVR